MLNKNGLFGKKEENVRSELTKNPYSSAPTPGAPATTTPGYGATSAAPAAPTAWATPDDGKGSKLIVGPNIKLKGVEITDCDTLVVEGRVEATMDSRVIQIAEDGDFKGTVGIDIAEIRGKFEGELTARQKLVIYATGSVSGKIRYGSIVVEEGGEISGDVASNKSSSGARSYTPESKSDKKSDLWVASDAAEKKSASAN